MVAGVVLAGGRSTRFGESDKAVAELADTPMIRRVADRLAGVVDELVVNCRADQREAIADALAGYDHPIGFAIDAEPDEGPMAGIETGLREVQSEYAFVVACDMPFLDAELVEFLVETAASAPEAHDAAVPRPGEWFETTHAVYRAEPMAEACAAALERGERKIIEPLFELDYVVVEEEELEKFDRKSFENVNTPEEFEAAEQYLSR